MEKNKIKIIAGSEAGEIWKQEGEESAVKTYLIRSIVNLQNMISNIFVFSLPFPNLMQLEIKKKTTTIDHSKAITRFCFVWSARRSSLRWCFFISWNNFIFLLVLMPVPSISNVFVFRLLIMSKVKRISRNFIFIFSQQKIVEEFLSILYHSYHQVTSKRRNNVKQYISKSSSSSSSIYVLYV